MMRSMYAAVAGLRTHQLRMDVIGDNIANVNTPGFKRARATFQDMFYQTLQGGSAPDSTNNIGGTNPKQIGLGISLASIDIIHTQGASAPTGKGNDLMIQGEGFFVLSDGTGMNYYTRAGAFAFDAEGNLVNPANGMYVLGISGDKITVPPTASSYSINALGEVKYLDENGDAQIAGQIAIAKFSNPSGLLKAGQNLYMYDAAAGDEVDLADCIPGTGGRGKVVAGALEMSNVELAQEFTEMIVTQRGFQANAKTITTSDEMLQELANLKR